ncbi:MAG: 2-hydroxychromene-2-carboxylate isomerase [Magnetospirillum sp.]|nr:2-hydroxychromene-2-carboxylate isomerase [Magnetospirillum sp.]
MSVIDFYFDFSSPYAYFASTRLDALAQRFGRSCRWRPMLLTPAFNASGNVRLIDQPMKGAYSRHDWDRVARLMEVPYRFPEPFPVGTVAAARAYWWQESCDPIRAKALGHALFRGYFAEGRDISQRDVVAAIGAEQGIDPAALLAAVDDPVWKAKLRDETEGAIASGVFGAPFIVVDGEAFWGVDRLWMVEEWLTRGGW